MRQVQTTNYLNEYEPYESEKSGKGKLLPDFNMKADRGKTGRRLDTMLVKKKEKA